MNLRCIYCQTPFTLARNEMLGAIITMNEKHQSHYDAHCPRCRRANSISRQRMELFFPNWQDAAKQLASAPPPAPKAETPASAMAKTEPLPKAAKATAEKKTAVKKPAEKATTKKPATTKASAAKKPAAKNGAEPKPKKK
jgi:hypothetical protein